MCITITNNAKKIDNNLVAMQQRTVSCFKYTD